MIYINHNNRVDNICVKILHWLTWIEKYVVHLRIITRVKIEILKRLITKKDYIDNDVTNIVCTKLDKNQKCDRALRKLEEQKHQVFRISPRAIVVCILNKNRIMLKQLRSYGYPLEIVEYAPNFHLIRKMCNAEPNTSFEFSLIRKYSMQNILYGI